MKKKLLILVACLFLLAACGKKDVTTSNSTSNEDKTSIKDTISDENVTSTNSETSLNSEEDGPIEGPIISI